MKAKDAFEAIKSIDTPKELPIVRATTTLRLIYLRNHMQEGRYKRKIM